MKGWEFQSTRKKKRVPGWIARFPPRNESSHAGDRRNLAEHVWIEYNFWHPSNTSKTQNPRYVMTSRAPGANDAAWKFVQFDLTHQDDQRPKLRAESLGASERRRIWCERVKAIVAIAKGKGETMWVSEFQNCWIELYPDEALAWYMPTTSILRAMEYCREVTREGDTAATWKIPPAKHRGRQGRCDLCEYNGDLRTYWRCAECNRSACVLCGHNVDDAKTICFLCEECWKTAWREAQVVSLQEVYDAYETPADQTRWFSEEDDFHDFTDEDADTASRSDCPWCQGPMRVEPESFNGACKDGWFCFSGFSCKAGRSAWAIPRGSVTVSQGVPGANAFNTESRRWHCQQCFVDICRQCMAEHLRDVTATSAVLGSETPGQTPEHLEKKRRGSHD